MTMNTEQNLPARFSNSRLESWALGILIAVAFLVPIAFISVPYLQQNAVKGYLIVFGVLASAILYVISRMKSKSFERMSHPICYVGALFIILLIISSVTSGNFMASFFGHGFEFGTAGFLIILAISSWLVAILSSRSRSNALSIYSAVVTSFIIVAIFQIVKLVYPSILSFGLFTTSTSTPVGSWYDFAIYSGVVFIMTFLAFSYLPMGRIAKYVAGAVFVVSSFFLILVGLPSLFFGIALVFLALIFYEYLKRRKESSFAKRLPIFAVIVFVVAVFFSYKGELVSVPLINLTNAGYSELHLPWQMTLDVGTGIIKSSPIFGSGPNTFAKQYLLYKPLPINQTQFWMTQFQAGSGFVPTIALSLGLSGLVLLCLLYVFFIREGVLALKKTLFVVASETNDKGPLLSYISCSSFFVASFLLFMDVVYVPLHANLFLTSVFVGVFLGSRIRLGDIKLASISFKWKDRSSVYRHSFAVIMLIVLCAGVVWYGMKAAALAYFSAGAEAISVSSPSSSDLTKAANDFHKAIALDNLDIYDQAIAGTDMTAVNILINQISAAGSNAKPSQAQVDEVKSLLNDAGSYAVDAIKRDPSNYYNYVTEAQVFSVAVSLQMQGAYAAAVNAYVDAAKYDPLDPSIYLSLAKLAASQGKYDDAIGYIGSALQLKNNYTDAVYLLSQIQVSQGKTADAITSVKFAVQLNPNDPTAYYELGLLQYNAAEYSDAVTSLLKAISLNPQYANAQYFLGLSYSKTGDVTDAIAQFQQLAKTNPDNADVASILANLKAGKSPFANQTPPVSTPEKRSSPPVSDQSVRSTSTNNSNATKSSTK